MKICRYDNNRLGLVQDDRVLDVTKALDVIPEQVVPALDVLLQVQKQVGAGAVLIVGKGEDAGDMLADEEPIGAGGARDEEWLLKGEFGEDPLNPVQDGDVSLVFDPNTGLPGGWIKSSISPDGLTITNRTLLGHVFLTDKLRELLRRIPMARGA